MRRPTTLLTRLTRVVAGLAASTLVAGLMGLGAPAPAVAAAACVSGWSEVRTPESAFLSTAFDIVVRDGKPAWIVGGTNSGVLALRWVNGKWRETASKSSGHRGFVGATSTGANKLLGVGYFRPYEGEGEGSLKPISGRVIGDSWKGISVADLPGPRATLTDVVTLPGGKAIAVGTRLQNGRLRATGTVFDGRRWKRSDPWPGTGSGLLGVWRTGNGAVWAVGWTESSRGRPRPYIVRRAGDRWKTVKAAPVVAGEAVLTDLFFRGNRDGYAVGYLALDGTDQHHVILMHWDGKSWKNMNLPWAQEFTAMPRSVSVGKDGTIWIAGTKTTTDSRESRGFIANGRAGSWRVSSLETPDDIRSEVMAVESTDNGAIAAATVGASLLVLKACAENLPSALKTASARKGVTKRKLEVSRMAARRASQRQDPHYLHDDRDSSAAVRVGDGPGRDAFSIAGDAQATLALAASPIAHPAFVVRDMAAASGLRQQTRTYDGFATDLDGNGYPDVFYSRHGTVLPRLAMNDGGTFSNASTAAFGSVDRHGCDKGDIDGDGNKDILCAVGASRGKAMKRHELSLNPTAGGGRLALDALGISDPTGRGRFAAVFKLDGDGFEEAFVTNAPDREDGWPAYNRFYRNVNGRLQPAPRVGLDASHGANCVATGDFDADGDQDLAYCTQYAFDGRKVGLRFMRNENGRLVDRTLRHEIRQIGDIDVAFADVTGDGRLDLIQLAPKRLRVSKWTNAGYRRIYEIEITDAWAVAAGDASGDGRADIYVVRGTDNRNKPDRLLVSRANGARFASVKIPTTSGGTADDVIALDYDKNGLMDFVVLNGRTRPGPVQLLASFPRG